MQAMPKGNYYSHFGAYLDEGHFRQCRAILGAVSTADWPEALRTHGALYRGVLRGEISQALYEQLHALTAAIFAQYPPAG